MSDESELEATLGAIAERLRRVEERLDALEARAAHRSPAAERRRHATPGHGPEGTASPAPAPPAAPDASAIPTALAAGGRTLLVLAGAFVLRALTDGGLLPAWLGVALGLAYAAAWLALADRAGAAGATVRAVVHGLAALLIAFPLVYEATARFELLPPAGAALALAAVTGAALAVAARRRLEPLGWLATGGAVATALALMVQAGRMGPATLVLVGLAVATLWLGYVLDWPGPRWPAAAAADLAALALALRAAVPGAVEGPAWAFATLGALLALHLASVAARTLLLHRGVVVFEIVQTAGVLAVALGGAEAVAARTGHGAVPFGAAALALGLAAYAVAFAFVERGDEGYANFPFYATAALLLVLSGAGMALPAGALGLAWAGCGLVAAALARRHGRATLAAHAALFGVAAALASGLVGHAADALLGAPDVAWERPAPLALAVLLLLGGVAWLAASATARTSPLTRAPQAALLAALAAGVAGLAAHGLVRAVAGEPGAGADPGLVAAARTAVLAAAAVGLAALGRVRTLGEAGRLAYPALVAGGAKLLLEDLHRGRPVTLFVAFGLYGAALIAVPRLRARRREPAGPLPGP